MVKRTLSDLMDDRGSTPVRLAADAGVSVATVYRARKGDVPRPLLLASMAKALGVSERVLRDAIERSAS